jgi:glutamine synthetase
MADNACLFKLLAKSVGMGYGIIPTFMAKPYTDVSWTGLETRSRGATEADHADARMFRVSYHIRVVLRGQADDGRHIHVSLRDKSGRNIFALNQEDKDGGKGRASAKYDDLKYISQEAEWFLGGLLEGLPSGELATAWPCPSRTLQLTQTVIPLMCPNINSYKRLLGGEVSYRVTTTQDMPSLYIRRCGLLIPPRTDTSRARPLSD